MFVYSLENVQGGLLATGSMRFGIKLWNPKSGEQVRSIKGHTDSVYALAHDADTNRLVSASKDQTIRVWNETSGECVLTIPTSFPRVFPLGFKLLSLNNNKRINLS